jgi:hypothetical protein
MFGCGWISPSRLAPWRRSEGGFPTTGGEYPEPWAVSGALPTFDGPNPMRTPMR